MPKQQLFSRSSTIRHLKRFQRWRTGQLDEWSKTDRCPPPKFVTKLMNSALYHLEHTEGEVWSPSTKG